MVVVDLVKIRSEAAHLSVVFCVLRRLLEVGWDLWCLLVKAAAAVVLHSRSPCFSDGQTELLCSCLICDLKLKTRRLVLVPGSWKRRASRITCTFQEGFWFGEADELQISNVFSLHWAFVLVLVEENRLS